MGKILELAGSPGPNVRKKGLRTGEKCISHRKQERAGKKRGTAKRFKDKVSKQKT